MELKEYLFRTNTKKRAFAEKVEIAANHLYGILSGRYHASRKLARRIESVTNGQVTQEEVLKIGKENSELFIE